MPAAVLGATAAVDEAGALFNVKHCSRAADATVSRAASSPNLAVALCFN